MISHVTLGTNDPDRAARFHDAVLGAIGIDRLPKPPGLPPAYGKGSLPVLYIYTPEDGQPATRGNGTHIALVAPSRDAVDRFHDLALDLGGSCAGPPGLRPHYGDNYHAAYIRDPDGNKLQAVCYEPV